MSTSEVHVSNRKGRPNYPRAYKRQMAMAACEPDVSVAKVALAHGLNTNMVFKWRREYRAGLLGSSTEGCALVPVSLPALTVQNDTDHATVAHAGTAPSVDSQIEIELNGARALVWKDRPHPVAPDITLSDASMIAPPSGTRIWLATGVTDKRHKTGDFTPAAGVVVSAQRKQRQLKPSQDEDELPVPDAGASAHLAAVKASIQNRSSKTSTTTV